MIPYTVEPCERREITNFVESNHYSKSINGVTSSYCFKLLYEGNIIGAAIFGSLGMANNWKKFADSKDKVVELRRLCCIDDTMKNTESFFISRCIRWIKQNTEIDIIVSYADPNHGHRGIIYQAANFKYLGQSNSSRGINYNGKYYHDKTIRTKYKGKLKPYAQRIKTALETGEAEYIKLEGKHCYTYKLVRK